MILGSHNSLSFLKPKKWWMRLIAFTARCQEKSIIKQYFDYGVRCFDIRVRFNKKGEPIIAHSIIEYDCNIDEYLSFFNAMGDCKVRLLHEARNKKQYHPDLFRSFCIKVESFYSNITFYHGKNLYNWETDYNFANNFSEEEVYASVCSPKLIDDWYPRLFAKKNNKRILKNGTDKDILLIDFVNYGY